MGRCAARGHPPSFVARAAGTGAHSGREVVAADMDSDGRVDIVVTLFGDSAVQMYLPSGLASGLPDGLAAPTFTSLPVAAASPPASLLPPSPPR